MFDPSRDQARDFFFEAWRKYRAGEPVVGHGPTVVTLWANELSRARGGPRCMTMPLERDAP